MVDKKVTVNTRVSTESPAEYEPKATTFQVHTIRTIKDVVKISDNNVLNLFCYF